MSELSVLEFKSQKDWEKWLDKNHGQTDGAWLKFAKKNSGETSVNYTEALEAALCYGWIDSQAKTFDDKFYLQKFSPRRTRSVWSKINREKIEKLIAEGKVKPAGLMQVEAAKADGRWEAAYDSQALITVPEDFQKVLAKNKKAAAFFETLSRSNRYSFLWRIHTAKRPETRTARIEKYVALLAEGKKLN